MATSDERKPDTVTFTFETTIDYVVDLRTGEVKEESTVGEIADEPHFVALFCEGEWAGEADLTPNGEVSDLQSLEIGDESRIANARAMLDVAFRNGTVGKSTTPEEIA